MENGTKIYRELNISLLWHAFSHFSNVLIILLFLILDINLYIGFLKLKLGILCACFARTWTDPEPNTLVYNNDGTL